MNKKQLLELFTPSFLSPFQQRLLVMLLVKLPANNKILFQIKASAILAGVEEKLSYVDFQKEMLSFIQKTYTIDTPSQLTQVSLITKVSFIKGKGLIELELNPFMITLLYELKQHFSLSVFKSILQFKSTYSIQIYLLLSERDYNQSISYSIDSLKRALNIEGQYNDYNTFKKRVVLQAQKELHLTDRAFFFKEEKEGRKVVGITFTIYQLNQLYWSNEKKYLVDKLMKDLKISEIQASRIVFQFIEEEIYNIIFKIKEEERAGTIKTSLAAYSVSYFNQISKNGNLQQ